MSLTLMTLEGEFSIHRLQPGAPLPGALYLEDFYAVVKTSEELTVVCSERLKIVSDRVERGWNCLKLLGPLDFGLTGVIAGISHVLAEEEISIFAISSYDTDYLLVRSDSLARSIDSLRRAGYSLR